MREKIKQLRRSKSESDRRKCIDLLSAHLANNPDDADAWYDKAGCHDFLGEEREAEPCYRKCFQLGWKQLPRDEQPSFFVGFGSTLRNNLKYAESVSVLKNAVEEFPDYPALKVFLALSYYSNREDRSSAEALFSACISAAEKGFDGYERAISQYIEQLRTFPESRDRNDSIEIIPYDPNWPNMFAEVSARLEAAIGGLCISIDHIGSTAVPGLSSKRRIDVQVTVPSIDEALKEKMDAALLDAGFPESRWNQDHRPLGDQSHEDQWNKLYISGTHAELNFRSNIHVRANGAANQIYPLLFRDYLLEHNEAVVSYERAKKELARFHPNDSVAYTELKDPICDLIMVDANRWAKQTKWRPILIGLSQR
ncbi:MAG: tetratricopeptide repeat protein [Bdellovibrionaceae bacterium]|nr:tetratricopeptide repeat protein [Pseudobdellovibrionaceae bacterium]